MPVLKLNHARKRGAWKIMMYLTIHNWVIGPRCVNIYTCLWIKRDRTGVWCSIDKKPYPLLSSMKSNGWPCSAKFCAFHITLKFSMVDLSQVWGMMIYIEGCEWPEIWWYDAMYHEADHYLKWPRSANVRIFWSQPANGAVVFIFDETLINKCWKIYKLYYNNFKCI